MMKRVGCYDYVNKTEGRENESQFVGRDRRYMKGDRGYRRNMRGKLGEIVIEE